ncbi:hypothetical protein I4N56_024825, partial [Pseudomonas mohnii]
MTWTNAEPDTLMARVLAPANLRRAYQRVVSNKGAPGADGMTVDQLADYVKQYWPNLKTRLLAGEYHPQGVRAVEIPKPKGGTRQLGIPNVVDRLIQQALLQQLTPIFDPLFSDYSYGFRPGRSAHQAIETARDHVAAGHRWCVELDLEKFFDRVNHDVLMAHVARQIEDKRVLSLIRRYLEAGTMTGGIVSRRQEGTPQGGPLSPLLSNILLNELDRELERRGHVARQIEDKRVLSLIRRYLEAGTMTGGIVSRRQEGTPQGGPLSPLLSNILLNELDRELERRGHRFVRYADDANIYVRSRRAGERVMVSVERFLTQRLKLTLNRGKSRVARPWVCDYLGYGMSWHKQPKLRVASISLHRLRDRLRELLRRTRARSMRYIVEQ